MKTPFFRFVLCLIVVCFTCVANNRAAVAPMPSVEDFCGVTDSKHIDNRNYARSITANLNVGEPRMVRMIYFLPNDRPYREDVVQRMKDEILSIQAFYAETMQAHGYNMTFQIETDVHGKPVVHRVDGQHPDAYYIYDTINSIEMELGQIFNLNVNIYFIVVDNSINMIGRGENKVRAQGVGGRRGKNGGISLIPATLKPAGALVPGEFQYRTAAHELGHAFGLQHDYRHDTYIMSTKNQSSHEKTRLSQCNADFLAVHPYFNPDTPIESGPPPTIELTSPNTYAESARNIKIQLEVKDSEGIHQVILFVILEDSVFVSTNYLQVKACYKLTSKKESVVEFNYDGDIPSLNLTALAQFTTQTIHIAAVDINGDVQYKSFVLTQIPSQHPKHKKMINILGYNNPSGDHQKWGLPIDVRIRLGKGGVGQDSNAVAFSPDGQLLAVSSDIGIWLYDAITYKELALLSNPWKVSTIAFSPDGKTILSARSDSIGRDGWDINLWDVGTREKIAMFGESRGPISFSPDGNIVASVLRKEPIIWNVKTGQKLVTLPHKTDAFIKTPIVFSPDGTLLASGGKDNTVKLWDVETWQNINTFTHKHTDRTTIYSIAFSPDGKMIASGSGDFTIKLWDVIKGTEITEIHGRTRGLTFSPDGKTLAWSLGKQIKLWDIATRSDIITFEDPVFSIGPLVFSPDGKTLVYASSFWGVVRVLDIERGIAVDLGHTRLTTGAFSPDNTIYASGDKYGTIKLWDITTGQNIGNLPGQPRQSITVIEFSPDRKILASQSTGESMIRLWDIGTQTPMATIEGYKWATDFTFSPDGQTFVFSTIDRSIKLWDIETQTLIATLEGHINKISSVSYSLDGKVIASMATGGTIKLWDVTTMQNIMTFNRSAYDQVAREDFLVNGKTFASLGLDRALRLWDATIQSLFEASYVYSDEDFRIFSLDGKMALVDFHDTESLWDMTTQTLIAAIRGFSPDVKTFMQFNHDTILLGDVEILKEKLKASRVDFVLSVEAGHDLIHIPLKVISVNGIARAINSIGDLYDVLRDMGGRVYSVSTWDPITSQWVGYYGDSDRGTVADKVLNDDTGIMTDMTNAVTIGLQGDALGTNGRSTITLHPGHNLVGIPLKDSRIGRVSDLFSLNGIRNNVYSIDTISGNWNLETISLPGKLSDTFVTGGQAFILSAHEGATITISGEKWSNISGTKAAPPIASIAMSQIETALLPNYPNPFNPETWIPFRLAEDADVTLTIYDVGGRMVQTLDAGHSKAGIYESKDKAIYWDGKNDLGESVASGVYFYHLMAGGYSATRRMVILK